MAYSERQSERAGDCWFNAGAGAFALAVLVSVFGREPARASCNQIPGTTNSFRAALGATNRPFAGPGDFVELRLSQSCDGASPGFSGASEDHIVTVLFTPPDGPRNVVVLSADCSSLETERQSCAALLGIANVHCLHVNRPGEPIDLEVAERDGERRLRFRFPDTDALLDALDDDRTFTGPATLAVTKVGDPLPCQLASESCAQQLGLVACIDALFATNGSCDTTSHPTFPNFTALPPPNNYQALCIDPEPPCTGLARELRLTVDTAGNILLPMDWRGVLVRRADVPIPRLVRASASLEAFTGMGDTIRIPSKDFLASYSPEGSKLPPVFDPQFDPDAKGTLTLFGSADAPETVLRIARQSPTGLACAGGDTPGIPCDDDGACPNGTCEVASPLFDVSARLLAGVGPVPLPRFGSGICQDSEAPCDDNTDCDGSPCVSYRATAEHPAPLDGLIETPDVFVSLVPEAIEGKDLNADGDTTDEVLLLADRRSGKMHPIGTTSGVGRAVTRIRQLPFTSAAVAAEDKIVAFLEAEPLEGYRDVNGDGDVFDTILRVFRSDDTGATEITSGLNAAVEVEPLVNGRSLAASGNLVFFRTSEAANAQQVTELASVTPGGFAGNQFSHSPSLSRDGRWLTFSSCASDLLAGNVTIVCHVFLRDRDARETHLVSVASDGITQGNNHSFNSVISADGWVIAFVSDAGNLVPGDVFGIRKVVVRDRYLHRTERIADAVTHGSLDPKVSTSADGRLVAFEADADGLVPEDTNGAVDVFLFDRREQRIRRLGEATFGNSSPDVSADGRWVAFSGGLYSPATGETDLAEGGGVSLNENGQILAFLSANSTLVPGDTNNIQDVFVRDRRTGTIERVSVASDGTQENISDFYDQSPQISDDGRLVAWLSGASNLVRGDANGAADVFVHDRLTGFTERVSLATDRTEANEAVSLRISMSGDGRFVAFFSRASNLSPSDANGVDDVFVRGPDRNDAASDFFPDGQVDDTVLDVLDTTSGGITILCPAAAVAVAARNAAFLRPEAAGEAPRQAACPMGSSLVDGNPVLNDDSDANDYVVHLWRGTGNVDNLHCAATELSLSETLLAALVSEAEQDDGPLNGDGDTDDTVVKVYPLSDLSVSHKLALDTGLLMWQDRSRGSGGGWRAAV